MDPHPRPAQLLDVAVTPDPGAVVERAEPVGFFLDDQHDGEVVEGQRHIQPPHALEGWVGGPARRFWFPTGRMPQDRSRLPSQVAGSTAIRSPSTTMRPLQVPSCAKRCASRVTRLPERKTCGCSWTTSNRPSQVRSAATFGFVEHDTQFSQRLDDLHPVTVDVLV